MTGTWTSTRNTNKIFWIYIEVDTCFEFQRKLDQKLKVNSFGRASFSYLAIQPPIDINFPWSLGFIRKLAFGSCWGNYFTPGFVCSQHKGVQKYQTYTDIALSGYQFTFWSSGASEILLLYPEKFTLGQCRIRTRDLSIMSQTYYHWTNMPS